MDNMNILFLSRLALAGLLGGIIGFDREFRAKEAGIRTHSLVCLGSALLMIISQHGFSDVVGTPGFSLDVSRVAAQVVSGIGFIGAGMIIIQKQNVVGLTSAAGIWATSGIGLAVGGGMYIVSIGATILTIIGFEFSGIFFRKIDYHTTTLTLSTTKAESIPLVTGLLKEKQKVYQNFESKREIFEETKVYHIYFSIRTKNSTEEMELVEALQEIPHITVEKIN